MRLEVDSILMDNNILEMTAAMCDWMRLDLNDATLAAIHARGALLENI